MIQCKPPVTPWFNNPSLAGKRPVQVKLPLTRIQYLREVPGFRSAGNIYGLFDNTGGIVISCDSGVLKCDAGHERRQNIGGKEKWGMGEGE